MKKSKRPGAGQQRAAAGRPATAALLAQAVGHHQAGRLQEAEQGYRTVLKDAPNNPDALHLSGVLALQMGQPAVAAELIGRAIRHLEGVADFHDNLGTALAALGRHGDAAQAHRRAVTLRPEAAPARYNLGNALRSLQRPAEAAAAFAGALALRPDYAKAWYNLANTLRAGGRAREAAEALGHAVVLAPSMTEARSNLGDALASLGRLDEALVQYRAVAALRPDDANAHYNLGATLQQMSAYERAELAYREAIRHAPRHPAALNNLGTVLRRLGRPAQAELCHRQALELVPDFDEARYNLGNALKLLGRFDEAAACYEAVLTAIPDLATASYNLALIALIRGDLARGWLGYERRFASQEAKPDRRIAAPLWQGELLRGRRLLIWREQGVGDEILFASCYRDMIAWAGGPVTIEADPRLATLFARSFPGATVRAESCGTQADGGVAERIVPPDCDLQTPAGSLPRRLRDALSGFAPQASWLVADPARVALWRERLAALGPGLKVGIGWRSQLMTAERRAAYTRLDQWAALFALPGVIFVNLQYDDCAAEIAEAEARFGLRIHRWDDLDLRDDFEASAALIANLDLVISPAMSAGELAGALGVPVWRFGARDWTQLGAGVRPWFPSMRLWQPRDGEALGDVLARMARELAQDHPPGPARHDAATHAPAGEAAGRTTETETEAEALLTRTIDLHRHGRFDEAEAGYRALLGLRPDHPDALHLLGLLEHQTGRHDEAAERIAAALRRTPDFPQAWNHLGLVQQTRGRPGEARACFARALAGRPDFPEALTHLGLALQAQGRTGEAKRWHRRSIRRLPETAAAHTNLGHAHELQGEFPAAVLHYRRALALRPELADAHNNLGTMARIGGDARAATRHLARALRLAPDYPLSAWNYGLLRLADGDLERGWDGYRRRFAARQLQRPRRIPLPAWRGDGLQGRRLLLWGEQGIGDELLFASCYGDLEGCGGEVVLECDRRLVPLFARAFPWATVRAEATDGAGRELATQPDADLQLPAGDLPGLVRRSLDRFPARPAYLTPAPEQAARWRERVATLGHGPKVGIGWRSQVVNAYRAGAYTTIGQWRPVFAVPGIQFVNLQYDDCAAEIASVEADGRTKLHRWPDLDLKNDFEAVAALIANLDLVIVPATSTGELAGALGVPVWRIADRDWTTLGTAVRPWFPAMRLWHPRPGEDLAMVIGRIAAALARFVRPSPEADSPRKMG